MLKVNIITHTPEPEKVVAAAAKLCYSPATIDEIMDGLTEDNVEKFITRLSSYGHHSPFEHVSFTFGVEGVSRSLTHQLVRHRIASFSQQSQRYVKANQFEYVVPDVIAENSLASFVFEQAMKSAQESYEELVFTIIEDMIVKFYKSINQPEVSDLMIDIFKEYYPKEYSKFEKIAIENARAVLPNATETKIVFTMNARSLLNFLEHRCCHRAQDEIKELALEILKQVKEIAPNLFKFAGASCMRGKCKEGAMCCGKPYSR